MKGYHWILTIVFFIVSPSCLFGQVPSTDIYLFDIDRLGDRLNYRNKVKVTDREGYDNQPSFTFNGKALLFSSIRENNQADIFRYDLLTGNIKQMTETPESEYSPKEVPGMRRFSVVRVEADSSQRMWRFPMRGKGFPKVMIPHKTDVGYYSWLRRDELALFLLEKPFVIRRENLVLNQSSLLTRNPGRAFQAMTTEFSLLYVEKESEEAWFIKKWGMVTHHKQTLVKTLPGMEDFCWSPDGYLLMGKGSKLYMFIIGVDEDWRFVGDLGIGKFDRLAISNDGKKLAVVAYRTP